MSLYIALTGLIVAAGLISAILVALLRAFSAGKAAGSASVRADSGEVQAAAVREKAGVDATIGSLPDADVRDKLRTDWGRK